MNEIRDLVIIGGGPAGLAAAYGAYNSGLKDILILERDDRVGGILNQCIHNGFGLHRFKEELTGPEYAYRYEKLVEETTTEIRTKTMVLDVSEDKLITCVSSERGLEQIQAKSIILAMGCRERSRGAISTPGDRVAGVYTAGAAQKYCNIDGYLVGKRVVILGSGDIGLIMARRMTLEGAKVLAVVELCPYSNGLNRNITQCLNDYDIPLYLSHTVTDIVSDPEHKRVKKVVISKVDEKNRPIKGTEREFDCDTLLLSVGLIPENELGKKAKAEISSTGGPSVKDNLETTREGIFACGNVLQVHDLVDNVSNEGERAGRGAAEYILGERGEEILISTSAGNGVSYVCPQRVVDEQDGSFELSFRVRHPFDKSKVVIYADDKKVRSIQKLKVIPSEMEKVTLKKELVHTAKSIKVAIEEE